MRRLPALEASMFVVGLSSALLRVKLFRSSGVSVE